MDGKSPSPYQSRFNALARGGAFASDQQAAAPVPVGIFLCLVSPQPKASERQTFISKRGNLSRLNRPHVAVSSTLAMDVVENRTAPDLRSERPWPRRIALMLSSRSARSRRLRTS